MEWLKSKGSNRKEKKTVAAAEEKKVYMDPQYMDCNLMNLNFREAVSLPGGLDRREWLATNSLAFFNNVNLLFGVVAEKCTNDSCPEMTAPANTTYTWQDEKGKKAKSCSAPQYIDTVMSSIEKNLYDESLFPTKYGHTFPEGFEGRVQKVFRCLFHIVGHIYHAHFDFIVACNMHGHLNTLFGQFIHFTRHFGLLDPKETAHFDDLVEALNLFPPQDKGQSES